MNVTLGKLISSTPTIRCGENNYPVLSMTMHDGIVLQSGRFSKRLASADTNNYKVVKRGQLVVGFPINEGVIYPQKVVDAGIMSPAYNVWNVNQNLIDIDYLEYCLHSPASMNYYASKLRGSTARRKSMPPEHLLELPIPLPPLDTQRRIVDILDKVKLLIAARHKQIDTLDKLAKDLFVDIFGDLEKNSMNWKVKNLLDIAAIDTRMTSDFEEYGECYHIGIENIEKYTGRIINQIQVKDSGLISGKYLFDERHIIYSKIRPKLNKVATPNFPGLCSADAYPILVKDSECDRQYLAFVMRSNFFLDYILDYSGRSNIPKVNKVQLSSFYLPVPPIEKQCGFAKAIESVEKQKDRLVMSLIALDRLIKSLTQQAFEGELFT